jgi:hypothetical protein
MSWRPGCLHLPRSQHPHRAKTRKGTKFLSFRDFCALASCSMVAGGAYPSKPQCPGVQSSDAVRKKGLNKPVLCGPLACGFAAGERSQNLSCGQ